MRTNKSKPTRKLRSQKTAKRAIAIVVVILFGTAGMYFLRPSDAKTTTYSPPGVAVSAPYSQYIITPGSPNKKLQLILDYRLTSGNIHAGDEVLTDSTALLLVSDPARVKYKGAYRCASQDAQCFSATVQGAPSVDRLTFTSGYDNDPYRRAYREGVMPSNPRIDQVVCFREREMKDEFASLKLTTEYEIRRQGDEIAKGFGEPLGVYALPAALPPGMCKHGVDLTGATWLRVLPIRPYGSVGLNQPLCGSVNSTACYTAPSPTPNPEGNNGNGGGSGGDGSGNGGSGKGTGTNGSGTGKSGTGSGGGGSSATKNDDTPKPTPSPAPQGAKEEQPKEQEPSPFYDGKRYSIGSDPDAQTPGDLVTSPSKALLNIWFYIITCIILVAAGIMAWFGWKRLNSKKPGKKK